MVGTRAIRVLCVDDNRHVADALQIKLESEDGFEWKGWVEDSDALLRFSGLGEVDVVILDLDMPGRDPFDAAKEMAEKAPDCRIVVFSGHVRKALIDSAVQVGVWGYVSKSDGADALVEAVRRVAAGEFILSPEVRATYDR